MLQACMVSMVIRHHRLQLSPCLVVWIDMHKSWFTVVKTIRADKAKGGVDVICVTVVMLMFSSLPPGGAGRMALMPGHAFLYV
jgi:hypothetical protein